MHHSELDFCKFNQKLDNEKRTLEDKQAKLFEEKEEKLRLQMDFSKILGALYSQPYTACDFLITFGCTVL